MPKQVGRVLSSRGDVTITHLDQHGLHLMSTKFGVDRSKFQTTDEQKKRTERVSRKTWTSQGKKGGEFKR